MRPSADDLIALRELPGVGERTLCRLVALLEQRGETVRGLLEASPARLVELYRMPDSAIRRLTVQRDQHLARCRWIAEELRRAGARVLTATDAVYPPTLARSLRAPAPMLFTLGHHAILRAPCLAILSSRGVVDHTLQALATVIRAARAAGVSIAIGGMKSTHRLAAMTSRAVGARRIVVLDRGLFAAFGYDYRGDPFGCGDRRAVLDRRSTLVLSTFRPEDHAAPDSARRRDQLITALGHVVFATSARPGGEVERTCLAAIAAGKPVLVWGDQNQTLIEAGAQEVDAARIESDLTQFFDRRGAADCLERRPAPTSIPHRTNRRPRSHGA